MPIRQWTNWDQLAVGDDFWDLMDTVEEKRRIHVLEEKQDVEVEKMHERRMKRFQINRKEFMENEPYSHMCKMPKRMS